MSTKMAHKAGGFGSYTQLDQEEVLATNSGKQEFIKGKYFYEGKRRSLIIKKKTLRGLT